MLNPISIYTESGTRAAKATNVGDGACYKFESDWVRRAFRLESPEDRIIARKAYEAAYKSARRI
jgi:hypothetical protein